MAYVNPGRLFRQEFGTVTGLEDICNYADFLRSKAGLTVDPPVDLNRIYARFEIPPPDRAPLGTTQGVTVAHDMGIIVINEDDPIKRQRFSEAHELMELLFSELPKHPWDPDGRGPFRYETKERLCNEGAAELLMPRASFLPYVEAWGCSFDTARELGDIYNVSIDRGIGPVGAYDRGTMCGSCFPP